MHQVRNWIAGAVALLMSAALAGGAMAQRSRSNPSFAEPPPPIAAERGEVRGPLPAPVGHRQPKASDIPSDAARVEGRVDPARRDLDAKLRICKGC